MNVSLAQATAAMNANARWQELISENLASSSVPGYRRQDISFQSVQAGVMGAADKSASGAQKVLTMPKAAINTVFSGGETNSTGVNTDVALEGPGFFEIRLANGSSAYTRNGSFKLNSQGELTTASGLSVLGDSGPIQKDLNNPAPLSISATGTVSQGNDVKGQLKIVDFNNPQLLQNIGGGLFIANNPDLTPVTPEGTMVRQNFLEASNLSTTHEMANMITSMRAFEANQRVVQASDERMSRVISELGSTS